MDWALFGSLIAFTLAGGVTPGPNNIILMSQGLVHGFRKCIPYIFGVAVGFALLLSSAILGLGAVIAGYPQILKVITIIGAIWLVWLAFGYFKSGWKIAKSTSSTLETDEPVKSAKPLGFFASVAFQWVNPKGLIFALGAAAGYVSLHPNLWVRLAVIVITFNVAGFIGNVAWAAAGGTLNAMLSGGKWARTLNIVMGVIILLTALFILKSGFTPQG